MKKILIAEDEKDIATLLRARFEERGFLVETTHSVKETLDRLKQGGIDVLTLDIFMPSTSGWAVLDSVRESSELKGMNVVLFTILETREAYARAARMNAVLVPKSGGEENLLMEVEKVMKSG